MVINKRDFGRCNLIINLPFFGWFGLIAAILFLAAILVVTIKGLIKPRLRLKVHRTIALLGAAFALVHIFLALRVYF